MKHIYLAVILVLIYCRGYAQHIQIPYSSSTVTVDGILSSSEWEDANSIQININASDTVKVLYRHDSTALYFAFSGKLESANALFPELLIDPQYQRGNSWTSGQWWFHVSATDCEHEGGYGVYDNCLAVQPDWQGAPNFTQGAPMTDTVEISIPFNKLGIDPAATDTFGIAYMVTNTFNLFKPWPGFADKDIPSTWATATLQGGPVRIEKMSKLAEIKVYPNPVKNKLTITGIEAGSTIRLMDLSGKVIYDKAAHATYADIDVRELSPGIYFLRIAENGKESSFKVIKQ